jgi:broad specificity phosphatase PhoE
MTRSAIRHPAGSLSLFGVACSRFGIRCALEPEPFTLIVSHGGVMRVVLAELLRIPPEAAILVEVPPACLTRLRIPDPPGRPSLMRHGCV